MIIQPENQEQSLTRTAYISGILGAVSILIAAFLFAGHGSWRGKNIDISLFSNSLSIHSSLLVIICVGIIMFLTEILLRYFHSPKTFFKPAPTLKSNLSKIFYESLLIYVVEALLLYLLIWFYNNAGIYADDEGSYYGTWKGLLYSFKTVFLYFGLPAIFFTRAFQHSTGDDAKSPITLILRTVGHLFSKNVNQRLSGKTPGVADDPLQKQFSKTAILGLMVKLFFIPIMTAFFVKNFDSMVSQLIWLKSESVKNGIAPALKAILSNPGILFSFGTAIIFAIDVGLGLCGYTLISRWLKNTYRSVEPTFLGWAVALLCYPPFNTMLFVYFAIPPDDAFKKIYVEWASLAVVWITILSYLVYLAATIVFGLRFSNLTNRGIITSGPYKYIRHPAYAAKNISWWFSMFPAVVYMFFFDEKMGLATAVGYTIGLITMSLLYYWRAITEERHLMHDPYYREYYKKVKYRFIPGFF